MVQALTWFVFNLWLIFHLGRRGFKVYAEAVAEFDEPALRSLEGSSLAQFYCVSSDLFLCLEFLVYDFLKDALFHLRICGPASSLLSLTAVFLPSEQVSPRNSELLGYNFYIFSRNNLWLVKNLPSRQPSFFPL